MRFLFSSLISFFSENLNSMRTFKYIDILISAGFIALFIFLYRIEALEGSEFSMAYMITGSWQLISMLVHFVNKWFTQKGSTRYYYHRIVAYYLPSIWLLGLILYWSSTTEESSADTWNWFVNISSTIMAVFYTGLCCIELISAKEEKNSTL
jgi:hypothetical protein